MSVVAAAYDIPHDRRRSRLHDLLLGCGEPVQRSVSECDLDDAAPRRLRARIRRTIRPGDRVCLYPLCAACSGRIDDGSGRQPPRPRTPTSPESPYSSSRASRRRSNGGRSRLMREVR